MPDARQREQPGTAPGPRDDRETSSPRGQDSTGGARQGADGTLAWSLTAMSDATPARRGNAEMRNTHLPEAASP